MLDSDRDGVAFGVLDLVGDPVGVLCGVVEGLLEGVKLDNGVPVAFGVLLGVLLGVNEAVLVGETAGVLDTETAGVLELAGELAGVEVGADDTPGESTGVLLIKNGVKKLLLEFEDGETAGVEDELALGVLVGEAVGVPLLAGVGVGVAGLEEETAGVGVFDTHIVMIIQVFLLIVPS